MDPLISIIVPVYNVEKYINRCIISLLNQTYKNLEIILVNDGSLDESGAICDRYAEKYNNIKVLHKRNGGLSSARNVGLSNANGEYIAFVDSDDWVANDMYESLYTLHKKYNTDVTQLSYAIVSDENDLPPTSKISVKLFNTSEDILKEYLKTSLGTQKNYSAWNKLYRKECFDNIKFPVGKLYEDILTNYEILSRSNGYVISSKIGYYYFNNTGSITRSQFKLRDLDYIDMGRAIYNSTLNTNNKELITLGLATYARTCFMCTCKILMFKSQDNVDISLCIDTFVTAMRKGYVPLVLSPMTLQRKIILTLLCLNKSLLSLLVKFRNKNNEKED